MLHQYATVFGDHLWGHLMIAVSFWRQDAHSIASRDRKCPGGRCQNETWFQTEIQTHFLKVLNIDHSFEFTFMDSMSQTPDNIEDPAQQLIWARETEKLWRFANTEAEPMKFKDVNDILKVSWV